MSQDFIINYQNLLISDKNNITAINLSFLFSTISIDMNHKINSYSIDYGGSIGIGNDISYKDYYLGFGRDCFFIENANLSLGYKSRQIDIDDGIYNSELEFKGMYLKFKKIF